MVVTVLERLPDPRTEVAPALRRRDGLAEVARDIVVETKTGVLYLDGNKEDALMTWLNLTGFGRDRASERRQRDGESKEKAAEHCYVGDIDVGDVCVLEVVGDVLCLTPGMFYTPSSTHLSALIGVIAEAIPSPNGLARLSNVTCPAQTEDWGGFEHSKFDVPALTSPELSNAHLKESMKGSILIFTELSYQLSKTREH